MKKFSLVIIGMLFITAIFAQKREVTSAWSYLKDGFLDDAKKSIDKATANPETSNWYKTYYYRGQIYQELGITDKKKYKGLCDNCLDEAYDSYIKAILLNFVNPEYRQIDLTSEAGFMKFVSIIQKMDDRNYENTESLYDIIGNRLPALSNAFINEGVAAYQGRNISIGMKKADVLKILGQPTEIIPTETKHGRTEQWYYDNKYDRYIVFENGELTIIHGNFDDIGMANYEKAYANFEKALIIATLSFKVDTQLYYFTSLAALKAKKFEEAVKLNDFLIEAKFGANDDERVLIILNQAVCYREIGKTDKMIETLQKGIEKYPNANYPLVIELFNYYVNSEQNDKALEYINLAINKNPNDPQFYVIRGTLNETLKLRDNAIADYKKAIELDPNNFDANYSAGAYYYNTGVDTLDWADKNIPITEFAKLEEFKKIANELFEKAKPYLEKAEAIQPTNMNVLATLKTIYYRLGEMEKYKEIDAKIKKLTE
ncbi:MAG TPA: tetratricopeptide repeat protein [Bacteroidales bacterium]|nr:tetratricopeptide repeat protein [Bacteroidales bacterium]